MQYTKERRAQYMRTYRETRRRQARQLLGGKCTQCGAAENLEFDHIDPGSKVKAIASMLTASKQNFLAEVQKCQLLCKAHHQEKSRAAYTKNFRHGTERCYREAKCRCTTCVTEQRERRRRWRM